MSEDDFNLEAKSSRRGGNIFEKWLVKGIERIAYDTDTTHGRERLADQIDILPGEFCSCGGHSRDVSAWTRKARDKTCPDRICRRAHDDRDFCGRLFRGNNRGSLKAHDGVNPERDEFAGERWSLLIPWRPVIPA